MLSRENNYCLCDFLSRHKIDIVGNRHDIILLSFIFYKNDLSSLIRLIYIYYNLNHGLFEKCPQHIFC